MDSGKRDRLSQEFFTHFVPGKAFLFIEPGAAGCSGFSWLSTLQLPAVIPLTGIDSVIVPGLKFPAPFLYPFIDPIITCDKDLYRQGKDMVHLFIFDPGEPGLEKSLIVRINNTTYRELAITLDDMGAGHITLESLPPGRYTVILDNDYRNIRGIPQLSFTVAEYQLAPLRASLEEYVLEENGHLRVTAGLTSFDKPVNGEVNVTVVKDAAALFENTVFARQGKIKVIFPVKEQGAYSLNIHLKDEPNKTATVTIPGSDSCTDYKHLTEFSFLGKEVRGSLLPIEGSRSVRGIYLLESSPEKDQVFELERVDTGTAHLSAVQDAQNVHVIVYNPFWLMGNSELCGRHTPSPDELTLLSKIIKQARVCLEKGKPGKARKLIRAFLRRHRRSMTPEAYRLLMESEVLLGNTRAAVSYLRRMTGTGIDDPQEIERISCLEKLREDPLNTRLMQSSPRVIKLGTVKRGQVFEIDTPSPFGYLAIGAFVDDQPWEGWATTISPSCLDITVKIPDNPPPCSTIPVTVEVPGAEEAYVVIKDARLTSKETVESLTGKSLLDSIWNTGISESGKIMPWIKKHPEEESSITRLEEALLKEDMITEEQLFTATATSVKNDQPLGKVLVDLGYISDKDLEKLGFSLTFFSDLSSLDHELTRSIPGYLARRYKVFPVKEEGDTLILAMADTGNLRAIDDIRYVTGCKVQPVLVDEECIIKAIEKHYGSDSILIEVEESVHVDEASRPGASKQNKNDIYPDLPDTIFAGIVALQNGTATFEITLGPREADYLIDVFAIGMLDWNSTTKSFRAKASLPAYLDVPPFAHPRDGAVGCLMFESGSQPVKVSVLRDGNPVPLFCKGIPVPEDGIIRDSCAEISFNVVPGVYESLVEESSTRKIARDNAEVTAPGHFRTISEVITWLNEGDILDTAEDSEIIEIRSQKGLQEPFTGMLQYNINFEHLCCEQTAARIIAGAITYLVASGNGKLAAFKTLQDDHLKQRAEDIISTGIARMHTMRRHDGGLNSYPDSSHYSPSLARAAASHLWSLNILQNDKNLSTGLAKAVTEGIQLSQDVFAAYGVTWPHERPRTAHQAYAALKSGKEVTREILEIARNVCRGIFTTGESYAGDRMWQRMEMAYAAAILLHGDNEDDLKQAISLTNRVLRCQQAHGGFYSTADTMATIWLMLELFEKNLDFSDGKAECDGKLLTTGEAELESSFKRVQVCNGIFPVKVLREHVEDWTEFISNTQLNVNLIKSGGGNEPFRAGDTITLEISLPGEYVLGDLVQICLPLSLSNIMGGGKVKLFSVDLKGRRNIELTLAATGDTADVEGRIRTQHLAVCLRNMFDEERIGFPGFREIEILPVVISTVPLEESPGEPEYTLIINPVRVPELVQLAGEPAIIRLADFIISESIDRCSTEISIRQEETIQVKCRTKDELVTLMTPPNHLHIPLVAHLQDRSGIVPGMFNRPREGEFIFEKDDKRWKCRVLTMPDENAIVQAVIHLTAL